MIAYKPGNLVVDIRERSVFKYADTDFQAVTHYPNNFRLANKYELEFLKNQGKEVGSIPMVLTGPEVLSAAGLELRYMAMGAHGVDREIRGDKLYISQINNWRYLSGIAWSTHAEAEMEIANYESSLPHAFKIEEQYLEIK